MSGGQPAAGEHTGYRPSPNGRSLGIGLVAALHLILLIGGIGWGHRLVSDTRGHGGGASSMMTLLPGITSSEARQAPSTAGATAAVAVPLQAAAPLVAQAADRPGGSPDMAGLAGEIAAAVGDDPYGGASLQYYRARLLRHIALFRRYPAGAPASGLVVVRFRLARAGGIIDAQVIATRGATLDEAALATLWRAEPLPAVPAELTVPWEVDIPIDFAPTTRG